MQRDLEVAILKDTQAFAALEEEWEELYRDSPLSTPFQSWSWLYSWWESLGEGYELRLITVRDGGLLVGLIPLMLERRWGFGRLLFVGRRGQLDLLAKKGWEDKVCEAGIRALRQMDSWHVIDLKDVSSSAAAWGIFEQWSGRRSQRPKTSYVLVEAKPWDVWLMSLSRRHRESVRRTLRRAEEDGVHTVLARPEEVEQAARRLVALHREMRQGRHINWLHLTPGFESFIVAAARRMTDRGLGGIYEFWRHGEVVMSSFTFFGEKTTEAYLVGVGQKAQQRYQWSSLGLCDVLHIARSRGSAYVNLGEEREAYKQTWASKEVPYYQIVMGRDLVSLSLYSMYLSLQARVVSYMKTNSTPTFIQTAAEWLRSR